MPPTVLCKHFPRICQLCGCKPAVLGVIKPLELSQELPLPTVVPMLNQSLELPLLALVSNINRWHLSNKAIVPIRT